MDWKPVAKRTRSCQNLYFKELHKRIKLERSSGGAALYGRFEFGIDGGGSVLEGLKQGCVGVESRSEVNGDGNRKRGAETVSDDDDDDVLFGGGSSVGDKVGSGRSDDSKDDDDVVLFGSGRSESEERSGVKGGVGVDPDCVVVVGVEDSGNEDGGGNMESSSSGMGSGAKLVEDNEDVVLTSDYDEKEEEGDEVNEAVSESDKEEEVVDDVDSDRLSDSDYEVDESNEEVEYDDDNICYFAEKLQKKIDCSNEAQECGKCMNLDGDLGTNGWVAYHSGKFIYWNGHKGSNDVIADHTLGPQKKIDCSNESQESGKFVDLDGDLGTNGWVAYHSGKFIYWNGHKETNDIIADHTQVHSGSDLMSQATVGEDVESMNSIDVLKPVTVVPDEQQNYSTQKKDTMAKHNTDKDRVGILKSHSPAINTMSKSNLKSKKTEDGSLSQPIYIGEEEEDDNDFTAKQMSKRGNLGKNTNKRRRPLKFSEVVKVLVDSMLKDNDGRLEELASQQRTVPSTAIQSLPVKFTFGVPNTDPPQKPEFEKKLDELWDEFDFALTASEIGTNSFKVADQNADSTPERAMKDAASYCYDGHHLFVIDEEIGVKCKHCSLVQLEIRHFMPSFSKYLYGRFEKRHSKDEHEYVGFDGIPFEDAGYNSQSNCGQRINAKDTVWDLIPGIINGMHPHQQEGFEFIWKNIAGGTHLSELQKNNCSDSGNGCIISHAPGTGKSRLTIAFLQTYMKLYPACRPVIIAPRSMLLSWEAELRKWEAGILFHNINMPDLSGKENALAVNLLGRANHHISNLRLLKLYSWKKDGGILALSYKLYEFLSGDDRVKGKRKGRSKDCHYDQEIGKILLETPDLLVLDEGHTPRNERSLIWKALCKIRTEKRIILSGTPFQNNFDELFNTLCLVRPKFADAIQSDSYGMRRGRLWKTSAAKGKWYSLINPIGKLEEGKVNDNNLKELRSMLDSFVHIYKGNILQTNLPGLRDSVIVLRPKKFQKRILEGVYNLKSSLKRNYVVSLVSVHPSLLPEREREHFPHDKDEFRRFRLSPEEGVKTKFLMELIRLSEAKKEKVLVFSEFIPPLNFIMDQLKSHFGWTEGNEILYMDGKIDARQRQSSINTFNDSSSDATVLLASKKACSEGINLVGASRVVLLDVVWNPSVERQAISRAYRLGQKKVVHVYQLISGTMEWDKYFLQAKKSWLSELVFSSTDEDEQADGISNAVSGDNILEEMVNNLKGMFEKIIHQPKESSLIETFGLVDQEATF